MRIAHLHLHGLLRGEDPELGRDADTGGQTSYVLQLSKALSQHPSVDSVELITRLIDDSDVSPDYAVAHEPINAKASIVRVPFGPKTYLRKEELWSHLDELVERLAIRFSHKRPDVIHAHYADAGHVAACLSERLGIPMAFTGHSYGQEKLHGLLGQGLSEKEIDKEFNIWRRIAAEEASLKRAAVVFTSTSDEAKRQLSRYSATPKAVVVNPPSICNAFHNQGNEWEDLVITRLFEPYLRESYKPAVLSISRLDRRKTVPALVEAFGRSGLKSEANLVLVLGTRDDIALLSNEARGLWRDIWEAIDRYDLHGSVALPKHHKREDVPGIYRWAAKRRGVFINAALAEPFGLTCVESLASGLPVIATDTGGPKDILKNGELGLLCNTRDLNSVAECLRQWRSSQFPWSSLSEQGVAAAHSYSWDSHVDRYLAATTTN